MKKVEIFQTYFNELSKSKLSSYFKPYDNRNPIRPNEYEFGVMKNLYYSLYWSNISHLGVISWKFEEKTRIRAKTIAEFLELKAMKFSNKQRLVQTY